MSFCTVEKLQLIKKRLEVLPFYNKLDDNEKSDLHMAICDGIEDIERTAFEYNRMAYEGEND